MSKLVIDTLRLYAEAERMGASPEAAQRAVDVIREMVFEAFDSGMSVEEIKAEFGRMAHEMDEMGYGERAG